MTRKVAPSLARLVVLLAVLPSLLGAGCARPSAYKAPVSKFRDASAVVIESTKDYLIALNKTERDHYLQQQAARPAQIELREVERVQVFTAEAIAVRLQALDQLADYTELLYRLATSEAPETVKARAIDLGAAVSKLDGEISKMSGAQDAGFASAAQKAFPVIGDILKAFVAQKIEDAIKRAVTDGSDAVNVLVDAISKDAEVAYQRKRVALSGRRRDAAVAYNTEFAKGANASPATLIRLAEAISVSEDKWEAFQTARPVEGLAAMRRANLALKEFASKPQPNMTDFATFVDAVEVFASAAQRVGHAVQQLKALDQEL